MAGFKVGILKSKSPSKSPFAPDFSDSSPAPMSISTRALVALPRSTTWCSWTTGPAGMIMLQPAVHDAATTTAAAAAAFAQASAPKQGLTGVYSSGDRKRTVCPSA